MSDDLTDASAWYDGAQPTAKPLIVVWCRGRRRPCRLGAVYSTPWGHLYVGNPMWKQRSSPGYEPGRRAGGFRALMTYPDGSRRDFGFMRPPGTGCRHGTPKVFQPFESDSLLHLLDDVRNGKAPRRADYVAPTG